MRNIAGDVRRVIRRQLGVNEGWISLRASLIEDLGADSLSLVGLMLALEEEFDIDITDDEATNLRTVADAIALVERARPVAPVVRRVPSLPPPS